MREVTAYALTLSEGLERGPGRIGVLIAEGDVVVDESADGLNQRPAFWNLAEG